MTPETQRQIREFLVERPNQFKTLEEVFYATGLLISKRTLQRFMRKHNFGWFIA